MCTTYVYYVCVLRMPLATYVCALRMPLLLAHRTNILEFQCRAISLDINHIAQGYRLVRFTSGVRALQSRRMRQRRVRQRVRVHRDATSAQASSRPCRLERRLQDQRVLRRLGLHSLVIATMTTL